MHTDPFAETNLSFVGTALCPHLQQWHPLGWPNGPDLPGIPHPRGDAVDSLKGQACGHERRHLVRPSFVGPAGGSCQAV